jgi:hypothetical protein
LPRRSDLFLFASGMVTIIDFEFSNHFLKVDSHLGEVSRAALSCCAPLLVSATASFIPAMSWRRRPRLLLLRLRSSLRFRLHLRLPICSWLYRRHRY